LAIGVTYNRFNDASTPIFFKYSVEAERRWLGRTPGAKVERRHFGPTNQLRGGDAIQARSPEDHVVPFQATFVHCNSSISAMTSPPTLPILTLPHPQILFPNATLTIPISQQSVTTALIALLKQHEHSDDTEFLVVGAVPTIQRHLEDSKGQQPVLAEWGVAAMVISLVKPPSSQHHFVTLQGIHRIRLLTKLILSEPLPVYEVSHYTAEGQSPLLPPPSQDAISNFKSTALRFLDVLSKDPSSTPPRRAIYLKLSSLLSGSTISNDKISLIADLLVSGLNDAHFNDKLGVSTLLHL